ncbi:unnamed protein product, partial [Ectocarpus sp. 13 AM-2016]
GGGGGGSSISVLGTHLRTYGWVRDEEVSECMNACGTEFTTLERRHHCRCVRCSWLYSSGVRAQKRASVFIPF